MASQKVSGNSPALPCSAETRWHKLDSRSDRVKIGGVSTGEPVLISGGPVHNWTIHIGHGYYGLWDYGHGSCFIWFGYDRVLVPLPASAIVAIFFLLVLLLLIAAWHFIGKLRDRDAPGDA